MVQNLKPLMQSILDENLKAHPEKEREKELKYAELAQELLDQLWKPEEKPTTFRINKIKCKDKRDLLETFDNLGLKYTEYKDIKDAYILDNYRIKDGFDSKTGLRIEKMAFYKNGEIYVQSLSSMLPVIALEPHENENILDKLIHCEMIIFENNTYIIKNWEKYQSADKYEKTLEQNRERQRRFRENQKNENNVNVTLR